MEHVALSPTLLAHLRSSPLLAEVHELTQGSERRHLCTFAAPLFGRKLSFTIEPFYAGGLRIGVPNVMVVPHEAPFANLHLHSLVVNGGLFGRTVLSAEGRMHYELISLGPGEGSARDIHALLELLRRDLHQLLSTSLGVACFSLLPVSPEMAMAMVHAIDESAGEVAAPRIAV